MARTEGGLLFSEYGEEPMKSQGQILAQALYEGPLTISEIEELLGVKERQAYRWLKQIGAQSLKHGKWELKQPELSLVKGTTDNTI